ncbi:aldo/keto reductase [Acetivibrio clariflavus]|uniref:Putative oxidoreductase of aldo/keto reductase family n=1 Tax=Acetivibrio clariflavus (strain DSM 19732 / NBRC 101661 / EBR45) TaxID=720554 RepID=G8LT83_ACECE|nr:aldo/keto reductase [Acetivibrio clariflavus]AEV68330.1 putative oxidoreductase of aldo/keto reductase family [Acetivibrio clariflavus DSM 19732]
MKYREDKYGNKLSVLGYGCMRFTMKAGRIDIKKANAEIMAAYEAGVNYFDTAYIYPGSEAALGTILADNGIRDKVNIATKLPHYMIRKKEDLDKYFEEQLKRLRTNYVDYYLMHMLSDVKTWERLKGLGIDEWLAKKKEKGAIRQVGFSYHGNSDAFCSLIDAYDWDFCMVQYNYLDETTQAGRTGVQYAASKGLPVFIMEPLRGGKLARNLPDKARQLISSYPIKRSPVEWSFRWLWNQPEVTCVLSGMNSLEMVQENVEYAATAEVNSFTEDDFNLIAKVKEAINEKMKVPCTGCRYCMPCPKGVDIPGTLAAYNRRYTDGKIAGFIDYFICTALRRDSTAASNCIDCGKCEQYCPQNISIRKELKIARRELEGYIYGITKRAVKLFMRY